MRTVTRSDDAETLGARLAACRHALGVSERELEELTQIPKGQLSTYEHGQVVPSLQTLTKPAENLNTSVEVLAQGLFLDKPSSS
jgi:transcriptional regulator with XRE-family HTH domain